MSGNLPEISLPPGALELARQSDLLKIDNLSQRVTLLKTQNEALRIKCEKAEKDQHEFVGYFQKELEQKETMCSKLKDELSEKEKRFADEIRSKCHPIKFEKGVPILLFSVCLGKLIKKCTW